MEMQVGLFESLLFYYIIPLVMVENALSNQKRTTFY